MSFEPEIGIKRGYILSVVVAAACTIISITIRSELGITAAAMIYLMGVTIVSTYCSRGAAILSCILSVGLFYYFIVPPVFSFLVMQTSRLLTLLVMMLVALVITGLTERIRAHTAAAHKSELAIETERVRNALLSAVSHDLKTPLVSIYGAATTILDQEDNLSPADRRGLVKAIADEARTLNRELTNLLEMTRLDAGIAPKKDWASLEEIAGVALSRLESLLKNRPVTVSVPADLPLIYVDENLMQHLLINVLENAMKYTPDDCPIHIVAEGDARRVKISIQDSGPGFKPGTQDHVFERFYRASSSDVHGTGLGLSICKAIVKAHDGQIRAENAQEGGAIIQIELPMGVPVPSIIPASEGSA